MVSTLVLATVTVAVAAWAGYPAWTRVRALEREASARWSHDGIREGMQPFAVGDCGPVLILVHGFASGPSVFRFMAPALAQAGYTCRVPRLPGFGERVENMLKVTEQDWRTALANEVAQARAEGHEVWLARTRLRANTPGARTRRDPARALDRGFRASQSGTPTGPSLSRGGLRDARTDDSRNGVSRRSPRCRRGRRGIAGPVPTDDGL